MTEARCLNSSFSTRHGKTRVHPRCPPGLIRPVYTLIAACAARSAARPAARPSLEAVASSGLSPSTGPKASSSSSALGRSAASQIYREKYRCVTQ